MSPETNGDNTLTTSFGWRVIRVIDDKSKGVVEWRCATCWQRYKAAQAQKLDIPAAHLSSTPPRSPRGGDT
jgi:hypothetical protein